MKPQPTEGWTPFSYGEVHKIFDDGNYETIGWGPCNEDGDEAYRCKFGEPGDRLWVRETFSFGWGYQGVKPSAVPKEPFVKTYFWADGNPQDGDWTKPWPSIFLPRYFSRLDLALLEIRAERLNDISEEDAIEEGITEARIVTGVHCYGGPPIEETADRYFFDDKACPDEGFESATDAYRALWEHINGPGSWDANPWVWVLRFTCEKRESRAVA